MERVGEKSIFLTKTGPKWVLPPFRYGTMSKKCNFLLCLFPGTQDNQILVLPKRMDGSIYSESWHCAGTADIFYVPAAKKFKGKKTRLQFLAEVENND